MRVCGACNWFGSAEEVGHVTEESVMERAYEDPSNAEDLAAQLEAVGEECCPECGSWQVYDGETPF